MAYAKKYYFQFAELETDDIHVVEFWQDGFVGVAEEVKCAEDEPFVIEMPDIDHKFQAVRGNGFTAKLLSDSNMKFFDGLNHVDPKEFQVLHYINGSLNWCGYLNSEILTEPYDQESNYIVTVHGNNGFSLLDRFYFIESDGTKYSGIKSQKAIMEIIFNEIGLPYEYIYMSMSTTIAGYTYPSSADSLFSSVTSICENYYDEDENPMTMREVLEGILAPYAAFITESGASLYITDIHNLVANSSVTYKKYLFSDFSYIEDVNVSNVKDVLTIGYMGTGQQIERSGGTNRQIVSYSPYPQKTALPKTLVAPDEFTTLGGFSSVDGYYRRVLSDHNVFQNAGTIGDQFEESYDDETDRYVYFKWPVQGTNTQLLSIKTSAKPYLNIVSSKGEPSRQNGLYARYLSGCALLLTGKFLIRTKLNPYDESGTKYQLSKVGLKFAIQVGGRYYNINTNAWDVGTPVANYFYSTAPNSEAYSDSWVEMGENGGGLLMPVGRFDSDFTLFGDLDLKFYSDVITYYIQGAILQNDPIIREVWIKDIDIRVVNVDGSEIEDEDKEYVGYLNELYRDSGDTVNLIHGTNTRYADRGKLLSIFTIVITEFIRNGQQYKIEELLLCSLSSNYRSGYITLTSMNLKRNFDVLNIITDNTYLGGSLFMIRGYNINFRNHRISCSLVEIFEDELIIVKV